MYSQTRVSAIEENRGGLKVAFLVDGALLCSKIAYKISKKARKFLESSFFRLSILSHLSWISIKIHYRCIY